MLQFNTNGLLVPAHNILIPLTEFETAFVFNQHRYNLYEEYLSYITDLQKISIHSFIQWIDGSFVTMHKHPKDIDIVTFVEEKYYLLYMGACMDLKSKYKYLDCYYVQVYPKNHKKENVTVFDRTEWLFLFSTNRKKQSKGFIELNF